MMTSILRRCGKTGWNSKGEGCRFDPSGDSAAGGSRFRVQAWRTITTDRGALPEASR